MFDPFYFVFLTLLHLEAEGDSNDRPTIKPMATVSRTEGPPPFLELPVFQHYRVPLVNKKHFSPVSGTGHEQLPDKIREILLPVYPTQETSVLHSQKGDVKTLCKVNKMHVQVKKSILGSGWSPSRLTLGTCQANKFAEDSLFFEYDLGRCGSKRSIVDNRVAYSNTLRYDPPKTQGPIRRSVPFTVMLVCLFNRHHYVYKVGYMPKVKMPTFLKQMTKRANILLTARNAQWERLGPSEVYDLGKPMYFQAEAPSMSKDGRLYVHSCHVTIKPLHTSMPQYTVIDNSGCMVESRNHSGSGFIPYKPSVVRFAMDAFLFHRMTVIQYVLVYRLSIAIFDEALASGPQPQQLYLHCAMSVGRPIPSATAKACNYDAKARGWKEVYGVSSVCSCCDSMCRSDEPSTTTKMVSSKFWLMENNYMPTSTQKAWTTSEASLEERSGRRRQVERPKVRPVKGFAVVDEEQVSEPHRTFEDIFGFEKEI